MLAKWENAVKKYDREGNKWRASKFSHICSKHFLETDYLYVNQQQHITGCRLKFNAIPSVNINQCGSTTTPSSVDTTDLTSIIKDLFTDCTSLMPFESSPDSTDHDTSNNTHMGLGSGINESTSSTTINLTSLVKDLFTDCTTILPSESPPDSATLDHCTGNNTHMRSGINEVTTSTTDTTTDLTSFVKDLFTDCTSVLPSESPPDSADHDTGTGNNTHMTSGINESATSTVTPLPVDKTDLTSLVIISLTPSE